MSEIISEKTMINAYILSPKYEALSVDGMLQIHKAITKDAPDLNTEAFLYHQGKALSNAAALADVLEKNPDNSVVLLTDGFDSVRMHHGPGQQDLEPVIQALRSESDRTSYDAIRHMKGDFCHHE